RGRVRPGVCSRVPRRTACRAGGRLYRELHARCGALGGISRRQKSLGAILAALFHVTFPERRDPMKLAKSILCGVAALGFMAGPAIAGDDGQAFWNASPSSDMSYLLYGVDDDMDGRPDRYVVIA